MATIRTITPPNQISPSQLLKYQHQQVPSCLALHVEWISFRWNNDKKVSSDFVLKIQFSLIRDTQTQSVLCYIVKMSHLRDDLTDIWAKTIILKVRRYTRSNTLNDHHQRVPNFWRNTGAKRVWTPCLLSDAFVDGSASFLTEISVSSPWKLLIFSIYKNIFWIKVSKKTFCLIFKTEALVDGRWHAGGSRSNFTWKSLWKSWASFKTRYKLFCLCCPPIRFTSLVCETARAWMLRCWLSEHKAAA